MSVSTDIQDNFLKLKYMAVLFTTAHIQGNGNALYWGKHNDRGCYWSPGVKAFWEQVIVEINVITAY